MVPAFGFSVGDFISAINLIKKVSKALKTAGGASSEYQLVIIELKGLKHVLRQLEALEPTEDNVNHVNAIRGMALACQLPLRDFLAKLEKYESSMDPFADRFSFRGTHHKAKWAVSMAEDVERLRALVAGKVISINLLLATHSSQTMSRIESRGKKFHKDLMTNILEHRQRLEDGLQAMKDQVSQGQDAVNNRLDKMSETTTNLHVSVINLRSLGSQILAFMGTFSAEIQTLLQKIIHTDQQMYNLLLQIQRRISASPTSMLQSNIRFEDALGRTRELPYEYFRYWEPFEGFLKAEFKNVPGEHKVLDGQYHIVDCKRQALISKESWTQSVFPGAELSMSMIMAFVRSTSGCCPRPSCAGKQILGNEDSTVVTCPECGLILYPISNSLADSLERVTMLEEDDEVARRQAEEDVRLFGARPQPQDPEEYDEAMQLDSSTQKRQRADSASLFVEPSRKKRASKEESLRNPSSDHLTRVFPSDSRDKAVTAIDWNSGETPLNAWLNQSALPSACLRIEEAGENQTDQEQAATSLEGKELEFYRKIHIPTAPEPNEVDPDTMYDDENGQLEPGARIYCRNIIDRFPQIPRYLARRLAEANLDRAKRLQYQKHLAESHRTEEVSLKQTESDLSSNANLKKYRCKVCPLLFARQGALRRHMLKHRDAELKEYRCDICHKPFAKESSLRIHMFTHQQYVHNSNKDSSRIANAAHEPVRTISDEVPPPPPPPRQILEQNLGLFGQEPVRIDSEDAFRVLKLPPPGCEPRPLEPRASFDHDMISSIEGAKRTRSDEVPPPLPPPRVLEQNLGLFGQEPVRTDSEDVFRVLKPPPPQRVPNGQPTCEPRSLRPRASFGHGMISSIERANGLQAGVPDYNPSFWTSERSSRRPASVRSRSSSMNSSLHGEPKFDPLEQSPIFSASHRGSNISSYSLASPRLPPPPVELGKVLNFTCDICGQEVKVKRRREWQQHVYQDLRPYVCTFPECEWPTETYGSRRALMEHELANHRSTVTLYDSMSRGSPFGSIGGERPFPGSECQFCSERIDAGKDNWMSHVGSHMETIAFAVVTRPYEDWEFYSDSSSSQSARIYLEIRRQKVAVGVKDATVAKRQRVKPHYICDCCPEKPKRFHTAEELRIHKSGKQCTCRYCDNRFKNKDEAERHMNSLHLRRHSWSCADLSSYSAAWHFVNANKDVCGYCGKEFKIPGKLTILIEHLFKVHRFGECNTAKKFFRVDHFRQHLKHSHAGIIGNWMRVLEERCMTVEPPPEETDMEVE